MLNLGQLTHLPASLANNPFHPMIVKFARVKFGSYEALFTLERHLLRYSWLALLVLFALVLPRLEDYGLAAPLVRLATLLYPCFFLWSLTRLAGVELMQLVLEGHWTAELLSLPMSNRDWMDGFVTPLWIVMRQYVLITLFSLALYTLEVNVFLVDDEFYWGDFFRSAVAYELVFFNAALWIAFVYLGRLYSEIRLRNGLLKGLATLGLLLGGALIFLLYALLFFRYTQLFDTTLVLAAQGLLLAGLLAGTLALHLKLRGHFRSYLASQIDLDRMIYDEGDPHASAWTAVDGGAAGVPASARPAGAAD